MSLLQFVQQHLEAHTQATTRAQLGDRTTYIGMSDIGQMLRCPRAAVLQKKMGNIPAPGLDRQIVLERGHWFERGLGEVFAGQRLPVVEQLEIAVTHKGVPVKAHLDFTFATLDPVPTVRVLECKTAATLPENLYAAYEMQLYGQIGLLSAYWNEPVFSAGKMTATTFPELCKKRIGIELPATPDAVDLQGWVLCLSMSDAKTYGPYLPDMVMLDMCLEAARRLWNLVQNGHDGDLPTVRGFHPLCSWCSFNKDCPAFAGCEHPEWDAQLNALARLKRQRTDIESRIEASEKAIRAFYPLTNAQGGWVSTGSWRFRSTDQAGRKTLQKDLLRAELVPLLGEVDTDSLLARREKQGAGFERLCISKVN